MLARSPPLVSVKRPWLRTGPALRSSQVSAIIFAGPCRAQGRVGRFGREDTALKLNMTCRIRAATRWSSLPRRILCAALLLPPLLSGWGGEASAGYRYPDATIEADAAAITEGSSVTLTVTLSRNAGPLGETVNVLLIGYGDFFNAADPGVRTVSIPGNGNSGTLTVTTVGDMADERSGLLDVTVLDGRHYHPAKPARGGSVAVAILDDDPTEVALAVTDSAADEDGGTGAFTLTLPRGMFFTRLGRGGGNPYDTESLSVPLSFSGGAPGTDFSISLAAADGVTFDAGTNTVTFEPYPNPAPGRSSYGVESSTTATLTLTPLEDADTVSETVTVSIPASSESGTPRLGAATLSGGAQGSGSGQITITDNDALFFGGRPSAEEPTVRIDGGRAVAEGGEARFVLRAEPAPATDLEVRVRVRQNGVFTPRTVAIAAGRKRASFTVAAADDSKRGNRGKVTARLLPGDGYALGKPRVARVGVLDNDAKRALSVSDARVKEGRGARLAFTVSLDEKPHREVRVSYATRDGTARANEDYRARRGTLVFGPLDTEKTVKVRVLDDAHDEGAETLELVLSDADGARIADAVGVGTIENADPMPAAWLSRFGRTVAEQTIDGIAGRMASARTPGMQGSLGGQALVFGQGAPPAPAFEPGETGTGIARSFGHGRDLDTGRSRTMTARDLLAGSRFSLTGETDSSGGSVVFWGRASQGRFDGRQDTLSLDGEVTTGLLGADYARGGWLVGLALARARGEGDYRDGGAGSGAMSPEGAAPRSAMAGRVESALTAAIPYASLRASERLKLWGAAGFGSGDVTLRTDSGLESGTSDSGRTMKADTEWTMAAAGLRGDLLAPAAGSEGGPALALVTDALWARTASKKAAGLVASDADVTRLRLGLEGSWRVALEGGGSLTPKLELGARHDGGDAETGLGVELGGGVAWANPSVGLSLDIEGRTLLAHGDGDLKDRGVSASIAFDPDPATERGPSLSLRQDFGSRFAGGLDALFAPDPLSGRSGSGDDTSRWAAEAAYGFPAFGDRFTVSPHVGLGLSDAARDYTLGWRLTPGANAPALSFGVKATLRESDTAAPEHAAGFEARARW